MVVFTVHFFLRVGFTSSTLKNNKVNKSSQDPRLIRNKLWNQIQYFFCYFCWNLCYVCILFWLLLVNKCEKSKKILVPLLIQTISLCSTSRSSSLLVLFKNEQIGRRSTLLPPAPFHYKPRLFHKSTFTCHHRCPITAKLTQAHAFWISQKLLFFFVN